MRITGVTLTGDASVFRGRYKHIYGVDGKGRGFRWSGGSTASLIGMKAPATAVTISTSAASTNILVAVDVINGGVGYYAPPTVEFRGGGLTNGHSGHAKGLAQIRNGRVAGVVITSAGSGYTSNPQVVFTGGQGSGASLSVGVVGYVAECLVTAKGTGYTNGATISFTNAGGAVAQAVIEDNQLAGVRMLYGGSGVTVPASAAVVASFGSGAAVTCVMAYNVSSVTVSSAGTGYAGIVPITFSEVYGSGANAYATAASTGGLQSPVLLSRGYYSQAPTAAPEYPAAQAQAIIRPPMKGSYRCCIRYLDDTNIADGGPIPSSITEPVTVTIDSGAQTLVWSWSNTGADARVKAVELWRTSANQALVLYRVALLQASDFGGVLPTTYTDNLTEAELISPTRAGYAFMPITLPSGQPNARRFTPPPEDMEVACWFQDRAWYGGNTSGTRPNTLMFSEIDEPESVPEMNEIIVQENSGVQDKVVGLIPYGAFMIVAQQRHLYRLSYVSQPIIDASVTLLASRGLLTKKCWTSFEGTLFLVDSFGMYSCDGSSVEAISAAVDNYWRDGIIDFSKSSWFFVQADPVLRVVRFHYNKSTDTGAPTRALCYSLATKSWWEEQYAAGIGAACVSTVGGRQAVVAGDSGGNLRKMDTGLTDAGGASIAYEYRSGALPIVNDPTRQIGVLYAPTEQDAELTVRVHYNNASTYRPNAIQSDIGEGVKAYPAGVVINMNRSRSSLGEATGYATARYSGRANDRSAGADRHLAVNLSGSQQNAPVVIHGLTLGGVTA